MSERWIDQVVVVAAAGVVDMITAPDLEEAIKGALAKSPQGVLVAAHDAAPEGVTIRIVAEGPATSRPLKLVGIADIVPMHATLDEALAAFSA